MAERRCWHVQAWVFRVVLALGAACSAVDFSSVPGEVLDYEPLHYSIFHSAPDSFISDPEIVVLSNGTYLASHALAGWLSGSDSSGETSVFISTNRGASWSQLGSTLNGILRASLFEKDGAVYLLGASHDSTGNNAVIMKSQNGGTNWTSSSFTFGGPATPNNPVLSNGRLWSASGTISQSAAESSDLMAQASWLIKGGFPDATAHPEWLSEGEFIGEGQIVASAEQGVVILPKVKQHALTALARVDVNSGAVSFDPNRDFAAMPGGEKKFGAAYDAVSGKFYVLSNPILPDDYDSGNAYDMIRNTAAVLTSSDLRNWKVEKLFLYSSDVDREGFGYLNFDFDDTNLAVIARTAFKISGETYPTRGHDSNLLTFHKLEDFRNLAPDQYLAISGNEVLRYERTQHQDAPLGSFALGTTLSSPDSLAQDTNGDVYVHQSDGSILRFDACGNFLGTVTASPVTLQSSPLDIAPPADGGSAWAKTGSGNWFDTLNWYYWNRPDTSEEVAVFGSAASSASTITLDSYSHEWLFETDDDYDGWTVNNFSSTSVSNGALSGIPSSTDPQVYRTDQSFCADTVSNITVRMCAATNNTSLTLYWGTSASNYFHSTRALTATYTGNGEFQDVTFTTAGHAQWDGQVIRRLRIDPLNGPQVEVAIDSIRVREEVTRVKGLRFINDQSYTLAGGGSLAIEAASGNGELGVLMGAHTVQTPVALNSDTDFNAVTNTSLTLTDDVDLNGNTLSADGGGTLTFDSGNFAMDGGRLVIPLGSGTKIMFTNVMASFNGEVAFVADESFDPEWNETFHIIEVFSGSFSPNTFQQLTLPELQDGWYWDTSDLYSNGNITVAGSAAPIADAGSDQQVADSDDNGSESVTLDGSGSSDPGGSIVSYVWTEGVSQIATGVTANVQLDVGVHTIVLTVTDNDSRTNADTVVVTVTPPPNNPPAFTTDPIVLSDALEGSPYTNTIAGTASDADSDPLGYSKVSGPSWLNVATNGALSGTPALSDAGTNTWAVQVADGNGGSDQASLSIVVQTILPTGDAPYDELTVAGTVSGSITNCFASDNVYEVLTEETDTTPTSLLAHEWTLDVYGAELVTFYVEAHHTANSEGDDFVFAWSTNGTAWTDLLTVTKTADDDMLQWCALPSELSGTVYVRATDTDRTANNTTQDSLYVDMLFIYSEMSTVAPLAATNPVPADSAENVPVDQDLSWTAGAMTVSHNVYFGTTPSPAFQGCQSGTTFDPGTLSNGTVYYWAIDEVNSSGTNSGALWSFTTTGAVSWTELTFDDFESGWGNWVDGGGDAELSGSYAVDSQCLNLQDNSGDASASWLSSSLDLSGYSELKIEFTYMPISMDNSSEDFWVQFSDDGGSSWTTVKAYAAGVDFSNGTREYPVLTIDDTGYSFTSSVKIKFQCDASNNLDDIYIDEIRISAR